MKTWKITITARTRLNPSDMLWFITSKLKEALPVISINYEEVSNRPTTTEHHGGDIEDGSSTEDI